MSERPGWARMGLVALLVVPPFLLVVWLIQYVAPDPPPPEPTRTVHLLAVNDVYRIEGLRAAGQGGLARLRSARLAREKADPNLIVLHAGDFLFPSLLSREFDGQQMVDVMNRLDGDSVGFDERMVVTFGNHEFEKPGAQDVSLLRNRVLESQFWWVGSDLVFLDEVATSDTTTLPGVAAPHLQREILLPLDGVTVGIYSLTYVEQDTVAHLDLDSLPRTAERWAAVARTRIASLRERADVVVGLTHLPMPIDRRVLELLGDQVPDVVIGGHEHTSIRDSVGRTPILKADADAKTALWVTIELHDSLPTTVTDSLIDLDGLVVEDTAVARVVDRWIIRHDRDFCGKQDPPLPAGCLNHPLGRTGAEWEAEELAVRTRETAIGDWLVQKLREAAIAEGFEADVALVNSGALRLNQNLPSGAVIERRHLEELIEFDDVPVLLTLPAETLAAVIRHSVRCLGSGAWLQVAGMSFRYDPRRRTVDGIRVGANPLAELDSVDVVMNSSLTTGLDEYVMLQGLTPKGTLGRTLRQVVYDAVLSAPGGVVSPVKADAEALQVVLGVGEAAEPCPVG